MDLLIITQTIPQPNTGNAWNQGTTKIAILYTANILEYEYANLKVQNMSRNK